MSILSDHSTYEVYGPLGGLATTVVLPEAFDKEHDKCPLAVLMHGFMSNKELFPLPELACALAKEGIASVRFDFDAHGESEGRFVDMTLSTEMADAKAVLEYVCNMPFVTAIALIGHSQGGVIAGMLAGEMENQPERPCCLVQLAPAAVLKDDALAGRCMNAKYDAANPPESVSVFCQEVGRVYFLESQNLPIYETSAKYTGRVCIIHGEKDKIVPISYSERYHQSYNDCELHILQGEGHMLDCDKTGLIKLVTTFLTDNLQ